LITGLTYYSGPLLFLELQYLRVAPEGGGERRLRRFIVGSLVLAVFLASTMTHDQGPPQSQNLEALPRNTPKNEWQVVRVIEDATIVAYSSTPDQTDSSPFIAAWGDRVFLGMVANNCLPRDTVVEIFGWRYRVRDRMNSRYGCQWFDIWHETREKAKQFGKKRGVTVKVLKRVQQ
jgi:hypothetical protein